MPDSQVIAGILAGNRDLYGLLVQRYDRLLHWTVARVLRSGDEVADVLQETHFRALTHIADFKGRASFSSWLTRIALNEARTRLRKRSCHREARQYSDEDRDRLALVRSESPNPEQEAMGQELREALRAAVGSLPQIYRVVFVLKELEDLSTNDVVTLLGINTSTCKTRLCRARRALRRKLHTWESQARGPRECLTVEARARPEAA